MQICPICRDTDNPMGILMDRRIKDTFESKYTVVLTEVCDKCKKTHLKKGVMLVNPKNGKLAVIKDTAYKRLFNKSIPKHRIAFADDELVSKLINSK